MKILSIQRDLWGTKIVRFLGIRIYKRFGYYQAIRSMREAIADPRGIGMLNLMMKNLAIPESHRHLFYEMGEGDVCIDCRANAGLFADCCLHVGASVHLFEPNGMLVRMLRRKYQGEKNVVINHAAVAAKEGRMKLYNPVRARNNIEFAASGTLVADYWPRAGKAAILEEEVAVIDLATYMKSHFPPGNTPPIRLLKIDIEGAEFDLLEKIINEKIFKLCKHIVVETHERMFPDGGKKLARLKAMISEHGADNISLDWV